MVEVNLNHTYRLFSRNNKRSAICDALCSIVPVLVNKMSCKRDYQRSSNDEKRLIETRSILLRGFSACMSKQKSEVCQVRGEPGVSSFNDKLFKVTRKSLSNRFIPSLSLCSQSQDPTHNLSWSFIYSNIFKKNYWFTTLYWIYFSSLNKEHLSYYLYDSRHKVLP